MLLYGFSPNRYATNITKVNSKIDFVSQENFDLYSLSRKARTTNRPNKISTRTLKANPLPTTKGKNILCGTRKTIKGVSSNPPKMRYLSVFFMYSSIANNN